MFSFNYDLEKYTHVFYSLETHTVGEPTRIILSGFPKAEGSTMMERKEYLKSNYDHLRSALMCEPRGHRDMVGAVLTEPIDPSAHLGVIYMDSNRWINMCGHASIGCATVAVETGIVPACEPFTKVVLETPAGCVPTLVKVDGQKATEVTFTNVPSFLYADDIRLRVGGQDLLVDVAFGGSFFALIDADQAGLELSGKNMPFLISFAARLLKELNQRIEVKHPSLDIRGVANVEFYGRPKSADSNQCNIVISAEGQVDRSPCGTGTSAKLAALYAKGKMGIGEDFINENFTGARFRGNVKDITYVGPYPAVVPNITGRAFISGYSTHVINESDPVRFGFSI